MIRVILIIFVLGAIIAAGVFLAEDISREDAERAIPETPALEPLAEHLSRATIPVSVPIAALGEALERKIPKQESGSRKNSLGEPFTESELIWNLDRSRLQVSGRGGALNMATELSGEARATGTVKLSRKTGFSAGGDILAGISLTANPALEGNWSVSPNLSATKIDIQKAAIPVENVGNIDVRADILPGVTVTADKLREQLDRSVSRSDFFKQAARKGWKRLCGSTPIGEDPALWLETRPVVARAARIRIGRRDIRSTIGVEVKTRVLTEQTRPKCPFPESLLLEKPKPGGFEIVMPVIIDYETLDQVLAGELVGRSLGKNISVVIKEISARPYGKMLLLETMVAVEADYLSRSAAKGTLYVVAEPKLDAEAQTITLGDLRLEFDSRNMLFSMAGKAAEPLLLKAVSKGLPLDLGPELEKFRSEAESAISALSSEEVPVTGKVRRVSVTRIDVGPEHLRLALTAEGRLRARVRASP